MQHTREYRPGGGSSAPRASRWLAVVLGGAVALAVLWGVVAYALKPQIATQPPEGKLLNPVRHAQNAKYDVWGLENPAAVPSAPNGPSVDPSNAGAVALTPDLVRQGRESFYKETFGNETFITDVVGLLDGPLKLPAFVKAIASLRGKATSNLQVELAETTTVAGRRFEKGTKLSTGLDVAAGELVPLGLKIGMQDGHVRAGITCAMCHSTVDAKTGAIVEGAPNADLDVGVMMALAPNSAAFFPNALDVPLEVLAHTAGVVVEKAAGGSASLPDHDALEDAVDRVLLSWPRGHFDSTPDGVANPSQIPSSFTREAYPYGWTGFAAAGPFKGLSVLNNNVHALNADPLANAELAPLLFEIDKEVFIATILSHAVRPPLRWTPGSGKPSKFLASIVPDPSIPGMAQHVKLPTYPDPSFISPNGLWVSVRGRKVWEDVNAMSAFQNSLEPPPSRSGGNAEMGRAIFEKAGCNGCHSGETLTNHRVVPLEEIGTEPARAPALRKMETRMKPAVALPFSAPVPVPAGISGVPVPIPVEVQKDLELAWAFHQSGGGYKVPALVGLVWTAPYLHDGGVAVGAHPETDLGVPGTTERGLAADPRNSLRALVDRDLRAKVVDANRGSQKLAQVHVQGMGHEFWVDATTGISPAEQDALLDFLVTR
jgi:hypothetical protein